MLGGYGSGDGGGGSNSNNSSSMIGGVVMTIEVDG